jgi:hypothetical protein
VLSTFKKDVKAMSSAYKKGVDDALLAKVKGKPELFHGSCARAMLLWARHIGRPIYLACLFLFYFICF